jgi:predicted phosphohydrolase
MGIYAIADLHLSFSAEKPMDIYGGEWINHTDKVKKNWEAMIADEDTVILPGDISWALRLEEAQEDLEWISRLPGKKILIKGNHDLWWNSIGKLNALYENMVFLQNSFYEAEGYAICGSRGWTCPDDDDFTVHDEKIYKRELGRLRTSLEAAAKAGYGSKYGGGEKGRILGVTHYPPASESAGRSGFTEIFEEFGVHKVIYGHLHGKDAYGNGIKGIRNGIEYILTSVDYLKCIPYKIL